MSTPSSKAYQNPRFAVWKIPRIYVHLATSRLRCVVLTQEACEAMGAEIELLVWARHAVLEAVNFKAPPNHGGVSTVWQSSPRIRPGSSLQSFQCIQLRRDEDWRSAFVQEMSCSARHILRTCNWNCTPIKEQTLQHVRQNPIKAEFIEEDDLGTLDPL